MSSIWRVNRTYDPTVCEMRYGYEGSWVKIGAWNIEHWRTALAAAHHITSHHPTHQQITTEQVSSGFFSSSLTSDQVKDHGAHLVCISFACREITSGMFKLIKLSILDYNRWSLEGSWQNTRRWFNAIKPEPVNRMAQMPHQCTSYIIISYQYMSIIKPTWAWFEEQVKTLPVIALEFCNCRLFTQTPVYLVCYCRAWNLTLVMENSTMEGLPFPQWRHQHFNQFQRVGICWNLANLAVTLIVTAPTGPLPLWRGQPHQPRMVSTYGSLQRLK